MIALYWAWRLGMFLIGVTPRRWSLAGARFFGNVSYYLMGLRRAVAQENFAHVLGKPPQDPQVRRVARQSFQNFACLLRDVMLYPSLSPTELEQRVTVDAPEHFTKALARGKGAIIVTAHFGNMDLPSAELARRFSPIALVSEKLRPPQLMDYLTKIRGQHQVTMHPYDRAPRQLLAALKRNEMAAFLIDFGVTHHFDMHTVPVKLFDAATDFPTGPAQLARLTGAAIIVGYAYIDWRGHITVYTNPPLVVEHSGDRQHDIQTAMQTIAGLMEDFIRRSPEQWYIFRPMWHDAQTLKRAIPSLSEHIPIRKAGD